MKALAWFLANLAAVVLFGLCLAALVAWAVELPRTPPTSSAPASLERCSSLVVTRDAVSGRVLEVRSDC